MNEEETYIPFKEIPAEVLFADFRMFYYCNNAMDWKPCEAHTHVNLERVDYISIQDGLYTLNIRGGQDRLVGKFISYPQYLPICETGI